MFQLRNTVIQVFFLRSMRLFESSLLDYWYEEKAKFNHAVAIKLLTIFKGEGFDDKLIDEEPNFEPLKFINIRSLFLLFLYCLILHCIVLCLEFLNSNSFHKISFYVKFVCIKCLKLNRETAH